MEILLLAALVVGVAIYYGFFDSAETVARMANRKVERLEAEQIKADIEYYNSNSIDDAQFEKAVEQKAKISTYRSI